MQLDIHYEHILQGIWVPEHMQVASCIQNYKIKMQLKLFASFFVFLLLLLTLKQVSEGTKQHRTEKTQLIDKQISYT